MYLLAVEQPEADLTLELFFEGMNSRRSTDVVLYVHDPSCGRSTHDSLTLS